MVTRTVLLASSTTNAAQSSTTYENDYYDSAVIELDFDTKGSASITLTLEEVMTDGNAVVIFTGPVENTVGNKRYQIFPGAAVVAGSANTLLPKKFKVTVTPQAVVGNDTYAVYATLYNRGRI